MDPTSPENQVDLSSFFIIEGLDGSGKTTLIRDSLVPYLQSQQYKFLNIKGLPKSFKNTILELEPIDYTPELLLVMAAQFHVIRQINLHLQQGYIVICDRLDWSTDVYQLLDNNDNVILHKLLLPFIPVPISQPYYFLLDISYDTSLSRIQHADKFERIDAHLWHKRRERYLSLQSQAKENSVIINADDPVRLVHRSTLEHMKYVLATKGRYSK